MPYMTTNDGARLHYAERGDTGPTVLLLGGWCTSAHWWDPLIDRLAAENRLIALDFRSHGGSESVLRGHTIERYARDVRELVDAADIRQITAIGWSLGANVLLEYWELFGPDALSALIYVDQSPEPRPGPRTGATESELPALMRQYRDDPDRALERLADLLVDSPTSDSERRWMISDMSQVPASCALALEEDHAAGGWREVLKTVTVPMLVVMGRRSKLVGPEWAEVFEDTVPRGRVVWFERSGHTPFREQPDDFAAEVRRFIANTRANGASSDGRG